MLVNASDTEAVARAQRAWLWQLQAMQPERPILAQLDKPDKWLPWYEQPANAVLWTRSVLMNEIVADADDD